MQLRGKTALITGSSRGIGRGIALRFAQEGCDIAIHYRERRDAAETLDQEIRKLHPVRTLIQQADVSKRDDVHRMMASIHDFFGKIDILVNNAGINKVCLFEEITDGDWDSILAVNLKGPFLCTQEVFPFMKARNQGRIINIASVAGQYHGPKTVHYAVSKAGLISLTKATARYGAPHNILVNAVAPGIIATDLTADELASPSGRAVVDMTLLKRPGRIQDVASACVWLASDEHSYTTGQVISVSGGAYLG